MRALVLVDLQNDFLPGGALAVKGGNEVIPHVQKLLQLKWDLITASKDWHPADHKSFGVNHGKMPGEKILISGMEQVLWPIHCVQGTYGAEFASGWDSSKVDRVFYKGTDKEIDSYSVFFDNQHKKNTGIGDFLREKKIESVYFAGIATDFCVKFSVLDALELGFDVYVIEDACRAVNLDSENHEKALDEMRTRGAHIIKLKDIVF